MAYAETVECPYCAEDIKKNAKKCKHCGEIVDQQFRDIEELKKQSSPSNVYMNTGGGGGGGGGGGSSDGDSWLDDNLASTGEVSITTRRSGNLMPYRHGMHILLSIFTVGFWIPIWILAYLFRNKNVYF